jgi:hypothetical protein
MNDLARDTGDMEAWQRRHRKIVVPFGHQRAEKKPSCPLPDGWEKKLPETCPTCGMGLVPCGFGLGMEGLPSHKEDCEDCGGEHEWGEDGWLIKPTTPLIAYNDHAHTIRCVFSRGWRRWLRKLFRRETWWSIYTEEYARLRGLDPDKYPTFIDDPKRWN